MANQPLSLPNKEPGWAAKYDMPERSKPPRHPTQLTLSAVLASAPNLFNAPAGKLVAVGKRIAEIDGGLAPELQKAKAVYLSKNCLRSLAGVQQFTNLRAFSAADNRLSSWDALAPLQAAPHLTTATFDGNPLADLPNYRAHVIHLLPPSLDTLDRKKVGPEERRLAVAVCAWEAAVTAAALGNACLLHKLEHAVRVLRVHDEMGLASDASNGADRMLRMLRLWQDASVLSAAERQRTEQAIVIQVLHQHWKLRSEASSPGAAFRGWQRAFAAVLTEQMDAFCGLLQQLFAFSAAAPAHVWTPAAAVASPLSGALASPQKRKHAWYAVLADLRDVLLNMAGLSLSKGGELALLEMEQLLQQVDSLRRQITSPSRSLLEEEAAQGWMIAAGTPQATAHAQLGWREGTPTSNALPAPASPDVEPELQAELDAEQVMAEMQAVQTALGHSLQVEQERSAVLAAALQLSRQDACAHQQAAAALTGWLEEANAARNAAEAATERARSDAAHAMQALEAQQVQQMAEAEAQSAALRQQLAGMADQREAARKEAAVLAQDLQQQQQQLAAAAVAMAPVQLHMVVSFEAQLQEARAEVTALQAQLGQAGDELADWQRAERARLAAEQAHDHALLHKALARWEAATARKVQVAALCTQAEAQQAQCVGRRWLAAWRLATQRSSGLQALEARRGAAALRTVLRQWRAHARAAALGRALESAVGAAADLRLQCKAFAGWRERAASAGQVEFPADSWQVQAAAAAQAHRRLGAAFIAWRTWTDCAAVPRLARYLLAAAHGEAGCQRRLLAAWRLAAALQRQQSEQVKQGAAARKRLLLLRTLGAWQRQHRRQVRLSAAAAEAAVVWREKTLSQAFSAWQHWRQLCQDQRRALHARAAALTLSAWRYEARFARTEWRIACKMQAQQLAAGIAALASWRRATASAVQRRTYAHRAVTAVERRDGFRALVAWRQGALLSRVAALQATVADLESHVHCTGAGLASKQAEVAVLQAASAKLQQEVAALQALADRVVAERQEATQRSDELAGAVEAARIEREQSAAWAGQLRDAVAAAHAAQLAAVEDETAVERAARSQAKAAHDAACRSRDEALAAHAAAATRAAAAELQCSEAAAETERIQRECTEAEAAAMQAAQQARASACSLAQVQEDCSALASSLRHLQAQQAALQHHLALTEGRAQHAEQDSATLQQALAASQQAQQAADHARQLAEGDARAAVLQSQRLAALLESHWELLGPVGDSPGGCSNGQYNFRWSNKA